MYRGLESFIATASYYQEGTLAEILMSEAFEELLRATSQGVPRLSIITNATLMNADRVAAIAGNLNLFCFSLDSHRADVYERLQGSRAQFETVVRTARELVARKKAIGSQFPLVQFGYTMCNENIMQFSEFCRFAAEIGVDRVVAIPLLRVGKLQTRVVRRRGFTFDYHEQVPAEQDVFLAVKNAKQEFQGSPLTVWESADQTGAGMAVNDRDLDEVEGPVCSIPWVTFFATTNGSVVHCMWGDGHRVGNWRVQGPHSVWNGPEMRRLRADFLKYGIAHPCVCSEYCPLMRRVRMFAQMAGEDSLLDDVRADWSQATRLLPFIRQAITNSARPRSWVMSDGKPEPLVDMSLRRD
jgi:MoaA/NifB/PqqE/SkfB family radical SAM enzyme